MPPPARHPLPATRLPGTPARGYTLVEMLLATALCGVLLAALWTLMSTYGELFDKGQVQVEQAQLGRALLELMAGDLRCAIQYPLPGPSPETAGGVQRRRFGLFGSSRELRFDVLQAAGQQANPVPVGGPPPARTRPRRRECRNCVPCITRSSNPARRANSPIKNAGD